MLTRFVRIQLLVFAVVSMIGMTVMVVSYIQVPTLLGFGKITVTMDMPGTGGLYRFSNVTYRGVQIGRVTSVEPTSTGATATLSLDASPRIPADVAAVVRSVSAVGEQYVDLRPNSETAPYLADGSVIPRSATTIPSPVGPVLDQLSALVDSVPKEDLKKLLDESFKAFNGSGYDLGSLLDSAGEISRDVNRVAEPSRSLIDDSAVFLDSQLRSREALETWSRSLAGVTEQLVVNDPQFRALLRKGPGFAQEVSRLLTQVKPTLPVLLANLTTVGQIGVTYNGSLEQLLVLLPPYVAATGSYSPNNNPTGIAPGGFAIQIADPPACTVGFLPPSAWRSPADETVIDTPGDLYCKLPQDSPIAVRGARNYPCMGKPGKRAPTVEICNSDKPYEPLAMRQHALGPYPLDPNLIAQGIPPDDRITLDDNIYAPVPGTPMPPVVAPAPPPVVAPPPPGPFAPPGGVPAVAPSAFTPSAAEPPGPAVAVVKYDPRTGRYVGPDGLSYRKTDLTAERPATWQDLLPR